MDFQLGFCFLLFDFRVTLRALEVPLEAVSTVNCWSLQCLGECGAQDGGVWAHLLVQV